MNMAKMYTAVEVSAPGSLRVVERAISEPGPGQVRIRVEACGICHTDAATVTGIYPGLNLPRVPGHEVVGRIDALGSGVSRWTIGQRVGVGFFGGEDGVCDPCRRGDMVNCQHPVIPGVTVDGGYAEVMIAEARGIASIPDELTSVEAAPTSLRGYHDLQRTSQRRLARRRSGRCAGYWWPRASWYPVCAPDGIPYCRNRAWTREGEACERVGRARLHRYRRRRCRSGTAASGRGQGDPRNSSQWWCDGTTGVRSCSPRQAHRGGCTAGPDAIECVPACLWRALDLRDTRRHGDGYRGRPCLQRPGEYPPDDRVSSSRTGG
jgi:hypothetical protein